MSPLSVAFENNIVQIFVEKFFRFSCERSVQAEGALSRTGIKKLENGAENEHVIFESHAQGKTFLYCRYCGLLTLLPLIGMMKKIEFS